MKSPKVEFSRHELCQVLGWSPDGRAYRRIEDSLDRIAGTLLKFKNAWWDKGEQEWRSHTFHLISNVELCSRDWYQRARSKTKTTRLRLCSFIWNDFIWKSFQDGYIRKIDMAMFRRIANGHRREVPVRLFRVLGKRMYKKQAVTLILEKLCNSMLGLNTRYPSRMKATIERASRVLIDEGFITRVSFQGKTVTFSKVKRELITPREPSKPRTEDPAENWFHRQDPNELLELEKKALSEGFGSNFEREKAMGYQGAEFTRRMYTRILYVKKYACSVEARLGGRASIQNT